MANIFDVSKYILEKKGRVTSWELQKLCYYCKAWSMALDDDPIFSENFRAWKDGPACRELFSEHRGEFWVKSQDIKKGNTDNLTANEKDVISAVIEMYDGLDGESLRCKTHREKPWIEARDGLPETAKCNSVISDETIKEYYRHSDEFETADDTVLRIRAERRLDDSTISFEEMLDKLGLTAEDIMNTEVPEIEVGFAEVVS